MPKALAGFIDTPVTRRAANGQVSSENRALPLETPVAMEYGGIAYAVMMATPTDLIDFAYGFSLSEGIITQPKEMVSVEPFETTKGWLLKMEIAPKHQSHILDRARARVAESSCGICGIENLEAVLKPLTPLIAKQQVSETALFTALKALYKHQPLHAATGGAHAAAFCLPDGSIKDVREDVGRHNALDKLIGSLAQQNINPETGFFLMTSRCSYELVEKTVRAGCPLLVTISTATSLAAKRAKEANLRLITLARPDAMLEL